MVYLAGAYKSLSYFAKATKDTKFRFREIWWRRRESNPENSNDNRWL